MKEYFGLRFVTNYYGWSRNREEQLIVGLVFLASLGDVGGSMY